MPNKSVEMNRRPASPLNTWRRFERVSCAPPFLSATVAHLWRSVTDRSNNMREYEIVDTNGGNISACSLCGNKKGKSGDSMTAYSIRDRNR